MNYKDAQEVRLRNLHLIGSRIGKRKIEDVVIIPANYEMFNQIVYNNKRDRSNDYILSRFSKFQVIVIYEETMTSNILEVERDPLPAILANLREAI
jgi:hypothetical protein